MTATVAAGAVAAPLIAYDMPEALYHSDPVEGGSLSCSGAKRLLSPGCPALFRWEQDNPPAPKDTFDIGHAAHQLVLGAGPNIVRLDFDNWTTKAAKEARDAVRAEGGVPLLPDTYQMVQDMAAALRAHPVAARLFEPGTGTPEVSLFAHDGLTNVTLRSRLDWLQHPVDGRRFIISDYKTAASANPEKFSKSAADFGYHQQAAWYSDIVAALRIADPAEIAFVFVVQEKTPPYLVTPVQLDSYALRIGRLLNRRAIDTYAECVRTGVWPGYVDDVALAHLPTWYERQFEQEI